ncbi:cysteine-rich receptor-like protein kinase, partial [Tanacetum coccineum]
GLYILIEFPYYILAFKALTNQTLSCHFMTIQPWNPSFRIRKRLTWVAISGLPPQLWYTKVFSNIAAHWGSVVVPEECNKRQFNRTVGKVCILTDNMDFICESVLVPINKEPILLRVYETDNDVASLFNGYLLDTSSDEEDFVEGEMHDEEDSVAGEMHSDGGNVGDDKFEDIQRDNIQNDDENLNIQTNGGSFIVGDDFSDDSFGDRSRVGTKSVGSGSFPVMENLGGYNLPEKQTGHQAKEGSTSLHRDRVNETKIPITTDTASLESQAEHVPHNLKNLSQNQLVNQSPLYPPLTPRFPITVSDSYSNIQRCNIWILSNAPCSASNEVCDMIYVANQIGFKMNGEDHKKSWIKRQCHDHRVNFLGLQETMTNTFNRFTVQSLWNNTPFNFAYSEPNGKSGGILAVWDTTYFTLIDSLKGEGYLALLGSWYNIEFPCLIVVVYAPHDLREKKVLWNNLTREIKEAVWNCGSSKAPGPDGFSFKFFKKYWSMLEHDIVSFVKDFEVSGLIPRGCNSSFITLVPKVEDPLVISDFRPISLIGSQYKIIAKILANRLSRVLPSVVGEVQMAYIKGRQIIDGPLMINEIIAWAKKHKKRLMFLKVDFEKAFDSLS